MRGSLLPLAPPSSLPHALSLLTSSSALLASVQTRIPTRSTNQADRRYGCVAPLGLLAGFGSHVDVTF